MKRPAKRKRKVSARLKRPNGRPPFHPTPEHRVEVQTLAVCGYSETEIARFIRVAPHTLRKHFRDELDNSLPRFIGQAVGALHAAVRKGEAWAVCFALKTKGKHLGFTERHEVTGKDGTPLFDLTRLSEDELDLWEKLQRKALQAPPAQLPPPNVHRDHETPQ